jgi:AcrR family transcriptional regulator
MTKTNKRRSPITKQGEDTVKKILDASEHLLKDAGYAKLTAKKISNEANIGTGSFYQYFSNKSEAVEALAARWLGGIEETFFTCLDDEKNSGSMAVAIANICQEILDKHYGNYVTYDEIYNISSRSDTLSEIISKHNKTIAEGIGQLLDNFEINYTKKNRAEICEFIRSSSIFLIAQISTEKPEFKELRSKMSLSMIHAMFEVDLS